MAKSNGASKPAPVSQLRVTSEAAWAAHEAVYNKGNKQKQSYFFLLIQVSEPIGDQGSVHHQLVPLKAFGEKADELGALEIAEGDGFAFEGIMRREKMQKDGKDKLDEAGKPIFQSVIVIDDNGFIEVKDVGEKPEMSTRTSGNDKKSERGSGRSSGRSAGRGSRA